MIKDVENVAATYDERAIYFLIDMIGGFNWRMNHDMAHGRIEASSHAAIDQDIEQGRKDQIVLVKALPRFGVDRPLDDAGRPTEQYWRWFRWWDAWKKGMSDGEWRACDDAMARGVTADEDKRFRPSGDWRNEEEKAEVLIAGVG